LAQAGAGGGAGVTGAVVVPEDGGWGGEAVDDHGDGGVLRAGGPGVARGAGGDGAEPDHVRATRFLVCVFMLRGALDAEFGDGAGGVSGGGVIARGGGGFAGGRDAAGGGAGAIDAGFGDYEGAGWEEMRARVGIVD